MHSVTPLKTLALIAWSATLVLAHPKVDILRHRHAKRIDWSNPDLYKGVNWNTINYGNAGAGSPPAATPPPAAPAQPEPAPAQPAPASPKQDGGDAPSPSPMVIVIHKGDNGNDNKPADPTPSPQTQPSSNGGAEQKNTNTNNNDNKSSGGGKRGIAYNDGSPPVTLFDGFSKITWAYNWNSKPGSGAGNNMYVPMLWSDNSEKTGPWDDDVKAATGGDGPHYLMSFNEPDMPSQANMDVGQAVDSFRKYMSPHASDSILLGTPAISNGVGKNSNGIPMGLDWLQPFLSQCTGCPISFAPVHWYGCDNGCPYENDVQAFKDQMSKAMDAAKTAEGKQVPIWITEFQRLGADADKFLGEILPWLDGQDRVQKYAYFMDSDGILAQGGAVSPLGQTYGQ